MTSDKAIEIGVRLETATLALKSALEHLNGLDEDDLTGLEVRESVEEMLQSAQTATTLINSVR